MNKSYKNIKEINKECRNYGVHINEKGELVAIHEGKEYKIGQASFFNEKGEPLKQEKTEIKRERERDNLKVKK